MRLAVVFTGHRRRRIFHHHLFRDSAAATADMVTLASKMTTSSRLGSRIINGWKLG